MKTRLAVIATLGLLLVTLASSGQAQQWNYVARLSTDASKGETLLRIQVIEPVVAGRALMIEDRDGQMRQVYKVHAVYDGFNVILGAALKSDFAAGAKIFQ